MKPPPRPPNDLLTIVYPESAPNSLVRRQAGGGQDYQDNIALDSQIAPLNGVLYTPSEASEGAPTFTPVEAVPDAEEARADTDVVDNTDRQSEKQDVVKNNVESDPQNTYLQVR